MASGGSWRGEYQWWLALTAGAVTLGAIVGGALCLALYAAGLGWIASAAVSTVVGVMVAAKLLQIQERDSP